MKLNDNIFQPQLVCEANFSYRFAMHCPTDLNRSILHFNRFTCTINVLNDSGYLTSVYIALVVLALVAQTHFKLTDIAQSGW